MADKISDEARPQGPRGFPSWQELYANQPVESMPWYNPELDRDLAAALEARGAATGTFLDIGTGPGTQARELARRGFSVTGTDLASAAIEKASALSTEVRWLADDILKTRLTDQFDFTFDRGCFHVLAPEDRPTYVANLKRLLKRGGTAFLKCFSVDQPGTQGPHRFSRRDIEEIFSGEFEIESIADAVYQGTMTELPRALFVVMRPRG